MSMTTTSASCFSATPRATVAPTFPAPPTTVTFRFIGLIPPASGFSLRASGNARSLKSGVWSLAPLHFFDYRVPELRRADLGRIVHQAREIVRDVLGRDRSVHSV